MVLNTEPLDCESSAISTRPFLPVCVSGGIMLVFIELCTYHLFLAITPYLLFQYNVIWHFVQFLLLSERNTETWELHHLPFFSQQAYLILKFIGALLHSLNVSWFNNDIFNFKIVLFTTIWSIAVIYILNYTKLCSFC